MLGTAAVFGPQRAGTRFVSRALAESLGAIWVAEEYCGFNESLFLETVRDPRPKVIHAVQFPYLIGELPDDVVAVMVVRDLDGIYKSREAARFADGSRVDFTYNDRRIVERFGELVAADASQFIYDQWATQKLGRTAWAEINYPDDVRNHPLWVDEPSRADWSVDQVTA